MIADAGYRTPGGLSLRLIDAAPEAAAALHREIGPLTRIAAAEIGGEPDLTIRFNHRFVEDGSLRTLGLRRFAYDAERFYVLGGSGARASMPIDRLGGPFEIACEPGIDHVPFVREALALRLLATDRLLLHSAAFRFLDRVVLTTGWQKGGKTELLLACMDAGAEFISDEWTVIEPATRSVTGLGDRLYLWDWHLAQLPRFRERLTGRQRLRLRLLDAYRHVYRFAGIRRFNFFPFGHLRAIATPGVVAGVGQVQPSPQRLFGGRRVASAEFDTVVLAAACPEPVTALRDIEPAEIASRMRGSQAFERRHLMKAYAAFIYAFPDRASSLLETADAREEALLRRALDGVPTYELLHPYPVQLSELRAALSPALEHPRR